jgi:hypothetical protein
VALYLAGPWDAPQFFSLTAAGTSAAMGRAAHVGATLSPSGRWLASPSGPRPADSIVVTNLEDGTSYTVDTPADFGVYGMAFDLSDTRLALVEVGPSGGMSATWAIAIVDLGSGSVTRFENPGTGSENLLPGLPIGFSASGNDLLLDTFVPDTEGSNQGIWRYTIPSDAAPTTVSALAHSELVPGEDYQTHPRLSPDGTRLLYLGRDFDYTPADYGPVGYDLAVNQLWMFDLTGGTPSQLVNVIDGDALARTAAWSPEGERILFIRGRYAGDVFTSLRFQIYDTTSGTVTEVAPLPLPSGGFLHRVHWLTEEIALYTASDNGGTTYLYRFDLSGGAETIVTSAQHVSVLPLQ